MSVTNEDELPLSSFAYPKAADHKNKLNIKTENRFHPIQIPKYSDKSFDYENQIVNYTGPLRSARNASVIPVTMSAPIYSTTRVENSLPVNQEIEPVDQHEHLRQSGPLGVCSDPYCIICPSYIQNNDHERAKEKLHKDQNQTHSSFDYTACFFFFKKLLLLFYLVHG